MSNSLSKYFLGIGAKRLSYVEVASTVSNQHEFNGISGFKDIFGTEKINFKGHYIYLTDDEDEIIEDTGSLTWYDARENHPTRTEYRLYYSSNAVIEKASAGDLVVIGRTNGNSLVVIVASQGATAEQQLLWLFGLAEVKENFLIRDFTESDTQLNFAGRYILSSLGFELADIFPDYLDGLIRKFGAKFPSTKVFSAYARSTLMDVSPVEEPDKTLVAWQDREEMLFRTFEKHLVTQRLKEGFGDRGEDVEAFITFSLSVQNRRKSRAGFAFENHLSYIFSAHKLKYSKGERTERNNKPDFLFPGIEEYRDESFSTLLLTMLGVKTSAKDRWRQVLSEANRVDKKHLITMEPAISMNQTDEMSAQNLQLVIPKPIMETYLPLQRPNLISLADFISLVSDRQIQIYG